MLVNYFKYIYIYLFKIIITCMYAYVSWACHGTCGSQKRVSELLELGSQIVVS